MIEWSEYIDLLIDSENCCNEVSISFGNVEEQIFIPPIVKASIIMLDKMIVNQGQYNIIVFPEKVQTIFVFTLMKLLHNIAEGKIEREYDPASFKRGEKLKLGNAVVEFLGIEQRDRKLCVIVKMADLDSYSAPLDFLPLFQRTNTQRRLSKNAHFVAAKKEVEKMIQGLSSAEKQLLMLSNYKTHMESSIIFMTSLISTKKIIAECRLYGGKVSDLLLIGQADYNGNIHNVGAGQLVGTPAIVLASDLYSIVAVAEDHHPIQSIIIDASNTNSLHGQLDELDKLMRLGVPVTFVTDVMNSFDLEPYVARNFNIWRWDQMYITDRLYDVSSLSSDVTTMHCAKQNTEYLEIISYEVSDATKRIMSHRNEVKEQSPIMMNLFSKLYALTFSVLRETVPLNKGDIERAHHILCNCRKDLLSEKAFLPPSTYENYNTVIVNLFKIYSTGYKLMKKEALENLLTKLKHQNVCLVIPERTDKQRVQKYWERWCEFNSDSKLTILFPTEYYAVGCAKFSATIVVGWLKREIMKKIIYSFNTQQYFILLYDYELRWKNCDANRWSNTLDNLNNKTIISRSFCTDSISISTNQYKNKIKEHDVADDDGTVDELNEIELVLRDNKYRQYVANSVVKSAHELTEAIPINYVGGFFAFYRSGHRVLSATSIIFQDADKIDSIYPEQLQVGDFVVVREADRDLIKEMADLMLGKKGMGSLREIATKWKDALKIEQVFLTPEQIYQKLVNVGCTKGFQTVRAWMTDDDIIAPQHKQDLKYITDITENSVMRERFEEIYDAAQVVRSAHIQAGKVLSQLLRRRIVDVLNNYGDIDLINIWEPMEMNIVDIGIVRILKIIDVGSPIVVDIADTNRLMEE